MNRIGFDAGFIVEAPPSGMPGSRASGASARLSCASMGALTRSREAHGLPRYPISSRHGAEPAEPRAVQFLNAKSQICDVSGCYRYALSDTRGPSLDAVAVSEIWRTDRGVWGPALNVGGPMVKVGTDSYAFMQARLHPSRESAPVPELSPQDARSCVLQAGGRPVDSVTLSAMRDQWLRGARVSAWDPGYQIRARAATAGGSRR